MSIKELIQLYVEDGELFKLESLDFEIWGIGQDELPRTMHVSADVMAVVTPPFSDTVDGERMGEFRAWLEAFIQGNQLSVAENPDKKPPETMLARVHPIEKEFWAIRVTDPEE